MIRKVTATKEMSLNFADEITILQLSCAKKGIVFAGNEEWNYIGLLGGG